MKKLSLILALLISVTAWAAIVESPLYKIFTEREAIKPSAAQKQMLSLLEKHGTHPFKVGTLVKIESLDDAAMKFILKTKDEDLCYVDLSDLNKAFARCLTKAGFTSYSLVDETPIPTESFSQSAEAQELKKRIEHQWTNAELSAILYLKQSPFIPLSEILGLEVIDELSGIFMVEAKDGRICYGLQEKAQMRCQSPAGIATVLYQGDSD